MAKLGESLPMYRPQKKIGVEQVLVAGNRGPCGGVNMALEAARQVLDIVKKYNEKTGQKKEVFSNWDLVNNLPVMKELNDSGLYSVMNDFDKVPEGSVVFVSAHGVPPSFHDIAREKNYTVIDATCQLVSRVHRLVKNAEGDKKHVVYIGAKNHPEALGVIGEIQDKKNVTFISKKEDLEGISLPEDRPVVVYSQTTLSTAEVSAMYEELAKRPNVEIPNRGDICYAADNRQAAVNDLVLMRKVDSLLVVGSRHSHNSQEMRKIGEKNGIPSYSVDGPEEIQRAWYMDDVKKVGVSSGASVLEKYTDRVLEWFRNEGVVDILHVPQVVEEKDDLTFQIPKHTRASIELLRSRYE